MSNTVKTITLKEAFERLNNFSQKSINDAIDTLDFKPVKSKIVSYKYMRDGKYILHLYCPDCGTEWEEEFNNLYSLNSAYCIPCPSCGNDTYYSEMYSQGSFRNDVNRDCERIVMLDADQKAGYILFGAVIPCFEYISSTQDVQTCLDAQNFDFMHGKWECAANKSRVTKFVYLCDKGFRIESRSGKSLVPVSSYDSVGSVLHSKYLFESQLPALCDFASNCMNVKTDGTDVIEQMKLYSSKCMDAQRSKRKNAEAAQVNLNDSFHPSVIAEDEIRHAEIESDFSFGVVADEYGHTQRIHVYCGTCGSFSDVTVKHESYNVILQCPVCGHQLNITPVAPQYNCLSKIEAVYFELMPENKYLVERVFEITEDFNGKYSRALVEKARIFYTDKQEYYFVHSIKNGWVKETIPTSGMNFEFALMQDKSEIEELINHSVLKYSGVDVAWGLDGSDSINEIGQYYKNTYISKWYKKPYLEKLLKIGLTRAVFQIIEGSADVDNPKGSTPAEILGISKPVLKIARELNLALLDIELCKQFYRMDQTITAQDFLELKDLGSPFQFDQLIRDYNISLRRIRDYLTSCYEHQCIEKNEALQIWSDYLRMADKLKYNLRDKDKKFPSSLKKEHDVTTFAYKRVEDQISKENFALQYKKNKYYEYEKGNLLVKVPETAEDIISEANQQKNCAASYVDRVSKGDTIVAFVRHKDAPETSYVTMEIFHGEIYQLRAFANAPVSDRDTLDFVKDFALKKNLRLNYR